MKEHFDDQYVKRSQQDGYRSRASYKLLEINEKDKSLILDLLTTMKSYC